MPGCSCWDGWAGPESSISTVRRLPFIVNVIDIGFMA
jgi:hypothetical protein